ncbi:MAG: hypothetical protein ABF293_03335 [Flavobacteriaceae bacterium]
MKDTEPEDHYAFTDDQLLLALEKATLNPSVFTHEAHLRWGWLLLERYGAEEAGTRACSALKKYTKVLGVPGKYNETVTIAAIKAIDHFRKETKTENFGDFINENSRLVTSFRELMRAHYSDDIFNSAKASQNYQNPDLLPFD